MKRIKDVLDDSFWLMPATPQFIEDGEVPYITSKNIKVGKIDFSNVQYISNTAFEEISKNRPIKKNDLIVSMIGTLGNIAVVKESDGRFYGQNMYLLRLNSNIVDLDYFYHFFNSDIVKRHIESKKNKSTQSYLKANYIEEIQIPIPSLDIQKKVASIFNKTEELISCRKEQLSKMDELVKARFVEMFGLPVSNSKNWKTEKMNDIAPAVNYSGKFEETVWLLNLDMVEAQTGRIIDYLYVSEEEVGNSTCTFDTSNVLYSKLRPYLNKVVIPNRCGYATSEMVPLKPNPEKLERIYLAFMLRSDEFVNMINEKVAGAKMPRVSMSDFRGFDVPVPPLELQKQFAAFVEQIEKTKSEVQKSLDELETLKKSLMQKYFG